MFLTFYIWAVVGTQALYYTDQEYEAKRQNSDLIYYSGSIYGNFQTFSKSMLALFQILTESSWHMTVLYTEIFNGFWITCLFLVPFHLFITFIMRSILLGFIWEVFAVVNDINNEKQDVTTIEGKIYKKLQILENLVNIKVQKKLKELESEKVLNLVAKF